MRLLLFKISIVVFGVFISLNVTGQLPRNVAWNQIYGNGEGEVPRVLGKGLNGDIILSGYVSRSSRFSSPGYWKLTNKNGVEKHGKYNDEQSDLYTQFITLESGNIFATNNSKCNSSNFDIKLEMYDYSGVPLWSKCIGSEDNEYVSEAKKIQNGNILLRCQVRSFQTTNNPTFQNYGELDAWLINIDPEGEILWQKNFGGSLDEFGLRTHILPNGNIKMSIITYSTDFDLEGAVEGKKLWLLELNKNGDILDSKILSINDELEGMGIGETIWSTNDWIYLIGSLHGDSQSIPGHHNAEYGRDAALMRYNTLTGEKQGPWLFGGTEEDKFERVEVKQNGNLILGGPTKSTDGDLADLGGYEFWLVEIDSTGTLIDQQTYGVEGSAGVFGDFMLTEDEDIIMLSLNESEDAFAEFYDTTSSNALPPDLWLYKLTHTATSVSEQKHKNVSFTLYPNPNNTGVLNSSITGNYLLKDLQGRLVKSYGNSNTLNVADVSKGIYILQHSSGVTQKVVLE